MADFIYCELPHAEAPDWANRFDMFKSGRLLLENQFNAHNLNLVERRDLSDGRRVYRVWPKDQPRLPKDSQGPYLFDPRKPNGRFRFTDTDPTGSTEIDRNWVNFRS